MKMSLKTNFIAAIFMLLVVNSIFATDYYCDPVNGNKSNNGSKSNPWNTLESVFAGGKQFQEGDKIYLLSGNHGDVIITGENTKYIKIIGVEGQKPIINSIVFGTDLAKAIKWRLDNVRIHSTTKTELVFIHKNSSKIRLNSNYIDSFRLNKGSEREENKVLIGINNNGSNCKFENNNINFVPIGLVIKGEKNQFRNNRIEYFSKNAIEITGNYNLFEYNLIKESLGENNSAILITSNPIKGNIIRGNTIINFIKPNRDKIGLMNGIYGVNLNISECIIENNIINSNNENGIALSGEINSSKIVNNTVVNPYFGLEFKGLKAVNLALSIKIIGTNNSNNVVIRNNLVNDLIVDKINGLVDYNLILPVDVHDYDLCFNNWALFDYSLSKNSKALNNGVVEFAPKLDASLNQRSLGNFINIGAFEFTKINDANETFNITAELTDRQVHSKGKADWDGQPIIRIGGSGEGIDGAGVFPFKLPLIPGGKKIISTNFITYYKNVDNKPTGRVDVYGLPPKANFWVTNDMFYQGTYGQDIKARPIQNAYVDSETIPGKTSLSAQGQIGLKNYINTIFETGSKAGDFIFLRLNPSSKDITDYHRWNFVSANSEKEDRKPILKITVGYPQLNKAGANNVKAIKNTIVSSANPLENGDISLYFIGFDKKDQIDITLFTFRGKEVLKTSLKLFDLKKNIYRTKNLGLKTGKYILEYTVGGVTKKQTTFVW